MNERDLRTAFNRLKDDVMMNVQTEERLEQVTRPHLARRRSVIAMAAAFGGAVAVALVVGAVVVALRPGGPDPVPPATGGSSTTVVDTSAAPTTEAPTTDAPTPSLPAAVPGTVLIADRDVAVIEEGDGYVAYLADRIVSDGSGGVVVQVDDRLIRISSSGDSGDLLEADDLAVDQGPVTIRLEDMARIDGAPHVLFTVTGGRVQQPDQQVWTYGIESGVAAPIHSRSEFESNLVRASLANDILLLTIAEEGTTYLQLLDAAGRPIELGPPFWPAAGTDFSAPLVQAVLAPDGATLVSVQIQDVTTGEDGFLLVELTLWDLAAGEEVRTLEVELRDGAGPGRLDFDGTTVVLGRAQNFVDGSVALPPLLIDMHSDAATIELGVAGTPSLVK